MRRAIICLTLFFLPIFANSQENGKPFIKNYLARDYGYHVQNWAAIQDDRGVMYFGNTDGILEYDGVDWRLISLRSRDVVRSMAKDNSGRIYVGGSNEIGYIAPSGEQGMQFFSLTEKIALNERKFINVWDIHIIGNDVYFRTDNYVFKYSNDSITSWHSIHKHDQSFVFNDNLYISIASQGLFYLLDNKFVPAPSSNYFKSNTIVLAYPYTKDTVILGTSNDGLIFYTPQNDDESETVKPFNSPASDYIKKYRLTSRMVHHNNLFYISTAGDGCIVINKKGDVLQKIDQSKGLLTNRLHNLFFDKHNDLWIATNSGISKVDISSPLSFWNTNEGLGGIVESIIRYKGRLYAGSHQGIFYIENNQINKIDGINTTCWSFLNFSLGEGKSHLFVGTSDGIHEIVGKEQIPIVRTTSYVYKLYQSKYNPNRVFACMSDGVRLYNVRNGKLVFEGKIEGLIDNVRSIYEENENTIWLGTFRNGAVKLTLAYSILKPAIQYYQPEQGLASSKNVHVFSYEDRFIFGSDKGINRYNSDTDRMEADSTFGVEFCNGEKDVFSFTQTSNGRIWILGLENKRSETGYLELDQNGKFSWVSAPFKQIPEMMVLSFFVEPDGTAWIGGSEGLFKYNPAHNYNYNAEFVTQIRRVTLGADSIIFNGAYPFYADQQKEFRQLIDFKHNSLTFNFAAITFTNEENNLYSFYLEGYDKKWSAWQKLPMKEYTNLPEGSYTFNVKAKNLFTVESQISAYPFKILSPWYRTIWSYIGYLFLLSIFVYVIVHLNGKRLKEANVKLEEVVRERTSELSEVNTQLEEQQAELEIRQEEITAQAELLMEKNRELELLSIVARETDNAVLIMDTATNFEWVNEGFFRLYKTDLKALISERGSNLLQASNNLNIHNDVMECLMNKKSVSYQTYNTISTGESLWLQTTLTPIVSASGDILKLIAIESDITLLKSAEVEIQKQRDELFALNSTKDKFFRIIAHDLRNPFNSILGFSELLIENLSRGETTNSLHFAKLLNQTSSSAYELLENLLTWSRSQSGIIQYNPSNINIKKILDYNILLLSGSAQIKGIKLSSNLTNNLFVFADKNMLLTVFRNLITNAIKFSNDGDCISIDAKESGKFITLSVADTGVGISDDIISKLFRIDGNIKSYGTANEPGTGLGLILCKEFVEKNNGEIWVESTVGKGSCFYFTLLKGEDVEES